MENVAHIRPADVSDKALVVWILSDGLPGHYSQSLGIVNAIARFHAIEVQTVPVTLRYKIFRPLMRGLTNHAARLCPGLLRLFYRYDALPPGKPELLVSAGGNTLYFNAALQQKFPGSRNLFSGTLKHYHSSRYFRIYTVVPLQSCPNNIVLDLPPVNIGKSITTEDTQTNCWCLLIGGEGAGYHYGKADWQRLADGINTLSVKHGIQWLISSSRRTGQIAEQHLEKKILPAAQLETVWYGSNPAKVVQQYLDRAERIFCTEDSLTMVSEAIFSGKPVCTLLPESLAPVENDRLALEHYADRGYIQRIRISELGQLESFAKHTRPDVNAVQEAIYRSLENRQPGP